MNQTIGSVPANGADPKPMDVDVIGPYEEFVADMAVGIVAKAEEEELDPAEPGKLSGANLILSGWRGDTTINVGFGYHSLGLIGGTPLLQFVSRGLDLIDERPEPQRAYVVNLAAFQPVIDGALSPFRMEVTPAPEPLLKIMTARHCFGVIRSHALRRFLEATLARAVFGKAVSPEVLTAAREAIRACLNPLQDLGEVQVQ